MCFFRSLVEEERQGCREESVSGGGFAKRVEETWGRHSSERHQAKCSHVVLPHVATKHVSDGNYEFLYPCSLIMHAACPPSSVQWPRKQGTRGHRKQTIETESKWEREVDRYRERGKKDKKTKRNPSQAKRRTTTLELYHPKLNHAYGQTNWSHTVARERTGINCKPITPRLRAGKSNKLNCLWPKVGTTFVDPKPPLHPKKFMRDPVLRSFPGNEAHKLLSGRTIGPIIIILRHVILQN